MKLSLRELSHTYSGGVKALDNFSLECNSERITALLGPNGAGKSTLFKILAGLVRPTSGSLELDGKIWNRDDPTPLAQIGFVFQDPTIDRMRSGQANLVYAAQLQGLVKSEFQPRIAELVEAFQMTEFIHRPAGSLSGGQRRRLEIARALIHRPHWLFLDEPSTGLDLDNRLHLSETLHQLTHSEGCGILWCTHIPDELLPGDQLAIMKRGKNIFDGSFDSLEQLLTLYNDLVTG